MYSGQIHEIGTPKELRNNLGLHRLEVRTSNLELAEQTLLQAPANITDVQTFGDRLDILVEDIAAGETQVRQLLEQNNLPVNSIEPNEPTLENVFVTRLRQSGSVPEFFPFPRYRGGNKGGGEGREGGRGGQRGQRGSIAFSPLSPLSPPSPPSPPSPLSPPSPPPPHQPSPNTPHTVRAG